MFIKSMHAHTHIHTQKVTTEVIREQNNVAAVAFSPGTNYNPSCLSHLYFHAVLLLFLMRLPLLLRSTSSALPLFVVHLITYPSNNNSDVSDLMSHLCLHIANLCTRTILNWMAVITSLWCSFYASAVATAVGQS